MVIYCHGWKNNSQSDNVPAFKCFLSKFATAIKSDGLHVHGVYLGWRVMFSVLTWTKLKWTAPTYKRCRNSAEPLSMLFISERTRLFDSFPRTSVIRAERERESLKRRDYLSLARSLPMPARQKTMVVSPGIASALSAIHLARCRLNGHLGKRSQELLPWNRSTRKRGVRSTRLAVFVRTYHRRIHGQTKMAPAKRCQPSIVRCPSIF